MTNVAIHGEQRVALPLWPMTLLAVLAGLAAVSLGQGIVDVVLPTLTGAQPFGFLFAATEAWGPAFFGLYVFAHNMGLACLVPGFGFVAVWFEKKKSNRGLIGLLLAGSVVGSLLVGFEFMIQASDRFDLARVLPLFALEAVGVLVLAIPSARLLKDFVPTPYYGWSLVTPFRRLRLPLVLSATLLAVASLAEIWIIFG